MDFEKILEAVLARSGWRDCGGLGADTMYGELAIEVAKHAVKMEREAIMWIINDEHDAIDRDPSDNIGKGRHSDSWKRACNEICAKISARNATA